MAARCLSTDDIRRHRFLSTVNSNVCHNLKSFSVESIKSGILSLIIKVSLVFSGVKACKMTHFIFLKETISFYFSDMN